VFGTAVLDEQIVCRSYGGPVRLTLRDVLELPAVARGRPKVRSGSDTLDTEVRWVHVSELANVAGTLSGGELILSIGVVLAEPGTDLAGYVDSLRDSGAAGLAVELGRHVERLPDALVQAARAHRFPVIELQAPVRFVEITETVHARVVNAQYERLSSSHRAHRILGPLGVEGASTEEILRRCVDLISLPVVLEDLAHRVIAFDGDFPAEDILRDWSSRSRQVPVGPETTYGGPEQWISTPVGSRRRRWGRLVVPTRIGRDDLDDVQLVLERTAEAVTITQLVANTAEGMQGVAAAKLIQDVLSGHAADDVAIRARALALGFATSGPIAVVMARGLGADNDPDGDLVDEVAKAARAVQRSALVGRVRPQMVAVLFDCPSPDAAQRLPERLVEKLADGLVAALAAGLTAQSWRDLPRSLTEAEHVASVAPAAPGGQRPVVIRTRDLGIRSLLWQIRDDSRLHSFIESRLGPVLALRSDKREETLHLLESYLQENGVMVPFARRVHLGRTAAYARVRSLERLLQSNLSNSEERTSMHVALIAYRQEDRRH